MALDVGGNPLYKTLSSEQKIEYLLGQQAKGLDRKDIYTNEIC